MIDEIDELKNSTSKPVRQQNQQEQAKIQQMHTFAETSAGVPAFLAKLWRLVDDPDTNNLICWTKDGRSFIIQNQAQFARELLPQNYKHNNMASFIRQLNMYGFHKISSIENGGLKFDRDEMEFSHPCFKRNCPFLLEHIKRKISNTKTVDEKSSVKAEAVSKVLQDVKAMRGRQDSLDSRFSVMKQENEALWREIASLRQKHAKQQQIVNKLIQFLITIVQPSRNMTSVKRHMQLMIDDTPKNEKQRKTSETESENGGPVIHELSGELLDDVGVLFNPISPYGDSLTPKVAHYDTESTSPVPMERPQSNMSVLSQNYDYSNQSAEEFFNVGGGKSTPTSTTAAQQQQSGDVYHIVEVPQSPQKNDNVLHADQQPNTFSDENVLTTPMVREQEERRRLLKEKNKQRRREKSATTTTIETVVDDTNPYNITISLNPTKRQQLQQTFEEQEPIIKIEPETDSMLLLHDYGDMNTDQQLISPNSQMSDNSQQQQLNINQDPAGTTNNEFYDSNFIDGDMPNDIFESELLSYGGNSNSNNNSSDAFKSSQQFERNTPINNGKFAATKMMYGDGANNNGASTSAAAAARNVDVPSTSIGGGRGGGGVSGASIASKAMSPGKNSKNMAVAKYTGGDGGSVAVNERDDVHDHLETVQDGLDSLMDQLRTDGYSLDQNLLMGNDAKFSTTLAASVATLAALKKNDCNLNRFCCMSQALEKDLFKKLFNDSDLLGLSFPNDNSNDKKGSELMPYQPIYDLSDIINDKSDLDGSENDNSMEPSSTHQLQTQSSVLNTPYHE